jgi:hypothetical protein
MIIVKLSGGLGNQLFQYSFGRYLSLKHNTELKLDVQLNINASDFTPRLLGLSKYNIDLNYVTNNEIESCKFFKIGNLSRIERKLNQSFPFLNKRYVVEKSFTILNKDLLLDDCYYDGYWQSEYYFKSIKNILINDLQFNFELNESNKLLGEDISNSMSVSLHIRRSDYLSVSSNSKIFSICTLKYYRDAISYFNLKFGKPIFYIFSDDIAWAKENFVGENFVIVDVNQDDPHSDMYLMSQCKHNIIANSSFSWWGAWLNSNVDKVVVCPSEWYRNNETNINAIRSLIPKEWEII